MPFLTARRQTPGKLRASRYPSHRPFGPAGPSRSRGHGRPRFSGGLPDSPETQERHQGNAPDRNATARQAGSFEEHFARAGPQSAARDAVRDAWMRVRRKGSLPASSIPEKNYKHNEVEVSLFLCLMEKEQRSEATQGVWGERPPDRTKWTSPFFVSVGHEKGRRSWRVSRKTNY